MFMSVHSTGVVSSMLSSDWVENQVFVLVLWLHQRLVVEVPDVVFVVGQRTAGAAGQCDSLTFCHHCRWSKCHFET